MVSLSAGCHPVSQCIPPTTHRAAAQLQLDLTSVATGRRFSATIAHFWSFEDGIPVQLVEYMDTALMARQSTPKESDASSPVHA